MENNVRILVLEHPEPDYGAAMLYHGLKQVLGEDGVVEWPYKPPYHGFQHDYWLECENRKAGNSPYAWMPCYRSREYSLDEVVAELRGGKFDLVVIATPRDWGPRAAREIGRAFSSKLPVPIVVHDSLDNAGQRWDLVDEFDALLLFDRQVRPPDMRSPLPADRAKKLLPMPFSCPADRFPPYLDELPNRYDIVYSVAMNHLSRVDIFQALQLMRKECRVYNTLNSTTSWYLYMRLLGMSKMGVATRGFTRDVSSYWEVPVTNTLMFCDDDKDRIPHPLLDGEHMVVIKGPTDLRDKIRYYLKHERERMEIAENGKRHVLKHHTCKARAEWFLARAKEAMEAA